MLSPLWNANIPFSAPTFPFESTAANGGTPLVVYGPEVALELLDLSNCSLRGSLPFELWNPAGGNLFVSLTDLSFANNPMIDGRIPTLNNDNTDSPMRIRTLNLSYTGLYGPVPLRFENLPYLQSFVASNTSLHSNNGAELPPWIQLGTNPFAIDVPDLGCGCPNLVTQSATGLMGVATLDPAYYDYGYCKCIQNYFGRDGASCVRCHGNNIQEHSACVCNSTYLQNCYPVYDRSTINLPPRPDGTIPAPTVITVLPCATLSGISTSNPNPQLSRTACNPTGSVQLNADGSLPSTGWCAEGHQGRLCSQCLDNYYRRGVECFACPSQPVRYVATALQIIILGGIFLWYYLSSESLVQDISSAAVISSAPMIVPDQPGGGGGSSPPKPSPHVCSDCNDCECAHKTGKADSAALHIVTFHAQLLGLLVTSQFALPASFSQLLSFSSNSSSFSVRLYSCCWRTTRLNVSGVWWLSQNRSLRCLRMSVSPIQIYHKPFSWSLCCRPVCVC